MAREPSQADESHLPRGKGLEPGVIAHVWGGKGDVLCIAPATGIRDNRKVTTRYNDFPNLKWLGLRQGQDPIFSPAESGRWVCIESHVKLNTPGKHDGVFELWVDGKPEASRTDLDWHGEWTDYGINAVFLENQENNGSIQRQARWFDEFVISTQPIGPVTALQPPTLVLTEPGATAAWEAEIAADPNGADIVWKSHSVGGQHVWARWAWWIRWCLRRLWHRRDDPRWRRSRAGRREEPVRTTVWRVCFQCRRQHQPIRQ